MLPFVLRGTRAGLEVVHPMAVVVLGGLVTSTLLGLFVLPALYLRFDGRRAERATPDEELLQRWAGVEPAPAKAGEREAGRLGAGRPASGVAARIAAARARRAAPRSRSESATGYEPSKLEPVEGARPPASDLHGRGRQARRPADGDRSRAAGATRSSPTPRCSTTRGQDLRLHQPELLEYLREQVTGRPHRSAIASSSQAARRPARES